MQINSIKILNKKTVLMFFFYPTLYIYSDIFFRMFVCLLACSFVSFSLFIYCYKNKTETKTITMNEMLLFILCFSDVLYQVFFIHCLIPAFCRFFFHSHLFLFSHSFFLYFFLINELLILLFSIVCSFFTLSVLFSFYCSSLNVI